MSRSDSTELRLKQVNFISKHPYLCAFIACMVAHITTFVDSGLVPSSSYIILTLGVGAFGVYFVRTQIRPKKRERLIINLSSVGVIIAVLVLAGVYQSVSIKGVFHIVLGFLLVLMMCYMLRESKDLEKTVVIMIIALSFILKFYYVFRTSMYVRQHDLGSFEGEHGHLSYIQYLYDNQARIDKDPRPYWQYYHPPLHHIISAAWMWLNLDILGTGINPAREGIQTLSLFYSMVIVITVYLILKHLKVKGIPLYASLTVIAFHPSFILLAGSVNNDTLSIALVMLSVLFTLKWTENQSFLGIVKIALSVGLAMMAKISTAVVAIPIAIVFLMVFIKNCKENGRELVLQYTTLGAIAFPLGLGYQIRNLVRFGMPITYVQELSKNIDQFLGEGNFIQRITDFSLYQFKSVFLAWEWNDVVGYNETNPLIALMKTAIFEESIREGTFPVGSPANLMATALFWVSVVIAIFAFVAMILVLVRKCKMNAYEKVLCGSFWLITMISYYKMAYDYPFVCTISFRYVTPVIALGVIFIGVFTDKLRQSKSKAGRVVSISLLSISIIFALLSIGSYTVVSQIHF
ncbi:MAG: glycosyltransferase family 39 protein [Clostridia bacterium]|nr:glycosyltransferase family 39 protein [Clostridia bacterium]